MDSVQSEQLPDNSLGVRTVYNYIWLDSIPVAQFRERCRNVCRRTGRALLRGAWQLPNTLGAAEKQPEQWRQTGDHLHTKAHNCSQLYALEILI
jgi:hypothetical protein